MDFRRARAYSTPMPPTHRRDEQISPAILARARLRGSPPNFSICTLWKNENIRKCVSAKKLLTTVKMTEQGQSLSLSRIKGGSGNKIYIYAMPSRPHPRTSKYKSLAYCRSSPLFLHTCRRTYVRGMCRRRLLTKNLKKNVCNGQPQQERFAGKGLVQVTSSQIRSRWVTLGLTTPFPRA